MRAITDLTQWFINLSGLEMLFVLTAAVGTLVFVLRFVLALFGADHGGDFDMHAGLDLHDDGSLGLFSLQGLSGFIMMFGYVGLALVNSGFAPIVSVSGAFLAGTGTMFLIGFITVNMLKLQSSGNIDIKNAVGAEGTVYLTIPQGATGQVQVRFQSRLSTIDAVSKDKTEIKTGERIKVVEISPGGTAVVERV